MYVWLHIIINYLVQKKIVNTVCEECKAGARGCVACKRQLAKNIIRNIKTNKRKKSIL